MRLFDSFVMSIVVLDLEWNGAYSKRLHGYINEIIEFGAVKLDEQLNITDSFSCFVKPQVGKRISSIITDLTSITDENLTDAMSFMQVMSRFKRWAGDCVISTWGTSDILALIENCRYFGGLETVPFLQRYADMQVFVERMLEVDGKEQLGLQKAAEMLSVDMGEIDHHRALDDSVLTAMVLKKLYTAESFAPFVQDCTDPEFYRRITFKTAYICDIDSPLIERRHLLFDCEKCGTRAKTTGKWYTKNKSLRCNFKCPDCGYLFCGQLRVKQKYEGITVSRKTMPLPKIEKPRKAENAEIGEMCLSIAANGVGLLRFNAWEDLPLRHAFSTRIGGVSRREFAAMNLGFTRGDDDDAVVENYRRFAEAVGVPLMQITAGAQDHNTNVRRVSLENASVGVWKTADMESVDGLVTNETDLPLMIYCADCVPLYFYDPVHHAIGLSHAGWRGTVNGMAKATIEKMQVEFGTDPADLLAAIGPSIGPDCFEVDPPCAEEFLALPEHDFVTDDGNGKFHVDLWECNRRYMLQSGMKPENITVGGVCSMCESDLVFSHRVTKGKRGSNAGILMLEKKA